MVALTVDQINASDFGVALRVQVSGDGGVAQVDAVEILVEYDLYKTVKVYPAVACDDDHLGSIRWLKKPHPLGTGNQYATFEIPIFRPGMDVRCLIGYGHDGATAGMMRVYTKPTYTACGMDMTNVVWAEFGTYQDGAFSKTHEAPLYDPDESGSNMWCNPTGGLLVTLISGHNRLYAYVTEQIPGSPAPSKKGGCLFVPGNITISGDYIGIGVGHQPADQPVAFKTIRWYQHAQDRSDCPDGCCLGWLDDEGHERPLPMALDIHCTKAEVWSLTGGTGTPVFLGNCETFFEKTWRVTKGRLGLSGWAIFDPACPTRDVPAEVVCCQPEGKYDAILAQLYYFNVGCGNAINNVFADPLTAQLLFWGHVNTPCNYYGYNFDLALDPIPEESSADPLYLVYRVSKFQGICGGPCGTYFYHHGGIDLEFIVTESAT
jgi:hypothetical protein